MKGWSRVIALLALAGLSLFVALQAADAAASIGDLSFLQCYSSKAITGCGDGGSGVQAGAVAIAVSPAGDSIYLVSGQGDSINHFRRAANGKLTPAGCIADS